MAPIGLAPRALIFHATEVPFSRVRSAVSGGIWANVGSASVCLVGVQIRDVG
jgi:hypothetical protein